jgi:hypothetical protein
VGVKPPLYQLQRGTLPKTGIPRLVTQKKNKNKTNIKKEIKKPGILPVVGPAVTIGKNEIKKPATHSFYFILFYFLWTQSNIFF